MRHKLSGMVGMIEIVLVVVVLAVVGMVVWRIADNSAEEDSSANVDETAGLAALPENFSTLMTFEEVEALAAEEIGDSAIVDITVEQDEDATVYQYRLEDGRILRFNAYNGELMSQSQGEQVSTGEPTFRNEGATISMEQAMIAAQNQYQNQHQNQNQNRIVRAGLGYEEGALVFQFTFEDDTTVVVDAVTGDIVSTADSDIADEADTTEDNGNGTSVNQDAGNGR